MKKYILGSVLFFVGFLSLMAMPVICFAGFVNELGPNGDYTSAQSLDSYFTYGTDMNIEIDAAGNLAHYSVSVMGLGNDNTYDYYSFSVGTAANSLKLNSRIFFDIDLAQFSGLDTFLTLYGTNGTDLLGSNNDSLFARPEDWFQVTTTNSFFSYEFDTAGTYYIQVGQNVGASSAPISKFSTYRLNISSVPLPSTLFLMIFGIAGFVGLKRKSWF